VDTYPPSSPVLFHPPCSWVTRRNFLVDYSYFALRSILTLIIILYRWSISTPLAFLYYSFDLSTIYSGNKVSNLGIGGHAFDATLYNSPGVSTTDKRVGSAALGFVASSAQYIQIPPLTIGSSGLTFAFWFKSSGSGTFARVFDFGNNPPGFNTANENIYFAINNNGADVNSQPPTPITDSYHQYDVFSVNVNDGVWRHVVWTIDISGNWLVYLNGVLAKSYNRIVYPPIIPRVYNYLGRSGWAKDPYLNGVIDEFYMYNSVLSAPQVSALAH